MRALSNCVVAVSGHVTIAFWVACWYGSTSHSGVCVKRLLQEVVAGQADEQCGLLVVTAILLTWLQCCVAFLVWTLCRLITASRVSAEKGVPWCSMPALVRELLVPGMLYCTGNAFTNLTMATASVSSTNLYKATEPLFVLLALRLLSPVKVTLQVVMWLVVLVLGVGLATQHKQAAAGSAMMAALCSNIAFAFSAVQIKIYHGNNSTVPMVDIFAACMACGGLAGVFVVTVMFVFAGSELLSESAKLVLYTHASYSFQSSVAYGLFNLFSFFVLALVSNTSHAVLKIGKRICTLVFASVLLNDTLERQQWLGVWVAVIAAIMHENARKETEEPKFNCRRPKRLIIASTVLVSSGCLLAELVGTQHTVVTLRGAIPLRPTFPGICAALDDLGGTECKWPGYRASIGCNPSQPALTTKKVLAVFGLQPRQWACPVTMDVSVWPNSTNLRQGTKLNGDNWGNNVWLSAGLLTVDQTKWRFVDMRLELDKAQEQRTRVDAVLCLQANLLRNMSDNSATNYANYFYSTVNAEPWRNLSKLLVGIGFQRSFLDAKNTTFETALLTDAEIQEEIKDFILQPINVKFLNVFEQSFPNGQWIARGRRTAAVAKKSGAPGALALGCPSFFLNRNPCVGHSIEKQFKDLATWNPDDLKNLKVALLMPSRESAMFKSLTRFLNDIHNATARESFVAMQTAGDLDATIDKSRGRFFADLSLNSWVGGLEEMDLIIGSRIHGSMMGLYAGRPTISFAGDYRVLEMVEAMMMPHVMPTDPAVADSGPILHRLHKLIHRVARDYSGSAFDQNRHETAKQYLKVYTRAGIDLAPHILEMGQDDVLAKCVV